MGLSKKNVYHIEGYEPQRAICGVKHELEYENRMGGSNVICVGLYPSTYDDIGDVKAIKFFQHRGKVCWKCLEKVAVELRKRLLKIK